MNVRRWLVALVSVVMPVGLGLLAIMLLRTHVPGATTNMPFPAPSSTAVAIYPAPTDPVALPFATGPVFDPTLVPPEENPFSPNAPPPQRATVAAPADALPATQLWAWVPGEHTTECGIIGQVIALSSNAVATPLRAPVYAVIERPLQPPLLIACADGHYSVVDAVVGRSWPLAEVGSEPYTFVVSPDGQQIAWATPARRNVGGGGLMGDTVQVADLQTGKTYTFTATQLPTIEGGYGHALELFGWGSQGVYGRLNTSIPMSTDRREVVWRLDPSKPNNVAKEVFTPSASYRLNSVAEQIAYRDAAQNTLILLDLRTDTKQTIAGVVSDVGWSLDGKTLGFLRAKGTLGDYQESEAVLRDIASRTERSIFGPLYNASSVEWTTDGKHVVVSGGDVIFENESITGQNGSAYFVLATNGTLLGKMSDRAVLNYPRFFVNDQIVTTAVAVADQSSIVRITPLQPNAATTAVGIPGDTYRNEIIYVPLPPITP